MHHGGIVKKKKKKGCIISRASPLQMPRRILGLSIMEEMGLWCWYGGGGGGSVYCSGNKERGGEQGSCLMVLLRMHLGRHCNPLNREAMSHIYTQTHWDLYTLADMRACILASLRAVTR